MDATYLQPWPEGITGMDVAICALIHFYVHQEPLNETGTLLTRLLSFTIRSILHVDSYAEDLTTFESQLRAYLQGDQGGEEETKVTIDSILHELTECIQEATSFSGIHNFFTRIERLLMREEMYDEIQNLTLPPAERQIDETYSPFGYFIHRCLETYFALEDDETGKVVEKIQDWVSGNSIKLKGNLSLSSEEEVAIAMRKGDYATARAHLEGSFDRPPAAMLGRTLPETLLYNAVFHVKTKAYEAARDSLREALRLARGVNDTKVIAACDDLLRQIEFEELKGQYRSALDHAVTSPNIQHKRDAYQQIEDAHPFIEILHSVEELQRQTRRNITGLMEDGLNDPVLCEYDLMKSNLWQAIGSTKNAQVLQNVCQDEALTLTGWLEKEQRLSSTILASRMDMFSGKETRALSKLIDTKAIAMMDIDMLQKWHNEVLRVLYQAAKRSDARSTTEKIELLRPEVRGEIGELANAASQSSKNFRPNEASFGQIVRSSREEELMAQLAEARELRIQADDPSQSLSQSIKVIDESKRSHLFVLYRKAVLEASDSLLMLGQTSRAKQMLDEIMPRALIDQEIELRAKVCWTYARIILSLQTDEACLESLSWLDRAITDFRAAQMWPNLKEVLYVKARITSHVSDIQQRDLAAREYNEVEEESKKVFDEPLKILTKIQEIAALISARTTAGG